ncbi:MAG: hypothetical protein RIQ87_559 [Chloroflexota bacterium]
MCALSQGARLLPSSGLAAKSELLAEGEVAGRVVTIKEGQQAASLTDELEKPAARMIVLLKGLQVARQLFDARREEGNLHLCRACVFRMSTVFSDNALNGCRV